MRKNLIETHAWYEAHNRLPEFYEKYICSECAYRNTCTGIHASARVECKDLKPYNPNQEKQTEPWNEMSYRKVPEYKDLGERLRRERGKEV